MTLIFKAARGQAGDPLSPLLFNFVAEVFTRMMLKAQANGMVTGLIDHLIPNGITLM
jgi:hypothetical protein